VPVDLKRITDLELRDLGAIPLNPFTTQAVVCAKVCELA
jgi:hypothetical protein